MTDNDIVWREYTIGGEEEEKLTNEETENK